MCRPPEESTRIVWEVQYGKLGCAGMCWDVLGMLSPKMCRFIQQLSSGKRLHNYGKSPFLIGKLTIIRVFSIAM